MSATVTDFLLAVEGLTVSFDGFKAVDDLSFYVDRNEIRVIIGPNGAGKTTVLDLICGRTKATEGSIKFDGTELTTMKEHQIVRAGVGRKFQNPSIYEDLTVFENLEISFPRGRRWRVRCCSSAMRKCVTGWRKWPAPSFCRTSSTSAPNTSPTARSSGWKSACC